jgi:hypothetical protein
LRNSEVLFLRVIVRFFSLVKSRWFSGLRHTGSPLHSSVLKPKIHLKSFFDMHINVSWVYAIILEVNKGLTLRLVCHRI